MYVITCIFVIIFGILQIILFFKIWKMTDHVKELNLTLKSKEGRELGLPRKAKVKSSDKEVEAYAVENGQILCIVKQGGTEFSDTFDYDDIELL